MIDHYIRQYGRRLYGLCLTLCANQHDAEDLYQDTWLKVLKNINQYNPEKDFESSSTIFRIWMWQPPQTF